METANHMAPGDLMTDMVELTRGDRSLACVVFVCSRDTRMRRTLNFNDVVTSVNRPPFTAELRKRPTC
jgi:hypothetical protein